MNLSDVSICRTFPLPRTMRCSFLFPFFLAPVVAVVVNRLIVLDFVAVAVLEAVGVAIHGVDESFRPDDQMRYAILWRVFWRYASLGSTSLVGVCRPMW